MVDLPIKNGDFPQLCERLPEGTGAKRREWMGCWGNRMKKLIVSQWIIPENSLRLAQVRKSQNT